MDETRVLPGNNAGWSAGSTDEAIVRHGWNGRDTLAVAVITTTVRPHGMDVIDLPPLSKTIDPSAFCQLFAPLAWVAATDGDTRGSVAPTRGRVGLRYTTYDTTIWADDTAIVALA